MINYKDELVKAFIRYAHKRERVHITVEELQKYIDVIKSLEQEPCEDCCNGNQIEKAKLCQKSYLAGMEHKQEPCDDCVSREKVWYMITGGKYSDEDDEKFIDRLVNQLADLPSVTPQPKTGHWIVQPSNEEQGERSFIWWKCSNCGQVIFSETSHDRLEFHAFCGRCGSRND